MTESPYERAACALLSTLPIGTILRVNATFCAWFGFAAADLVQKKRMQDLLTTGCKIFHQTHWLPLLQMQGSVAEVQLEFLHRDGHAIPALVNAVQHVEPSGTTVEIAVFVAADRRRYERELLHARRRAEELLELLREQERQARERAELVEQLIGIVSHDLRTPLQAVSLGATLLSTDELTPTQSRTVSRISSASQRAQRLILDLLDFTQARLSGAISVAKKECELRAIVADVVDELKLAWPGRMIEQRSEGTGDCVVDSDRISQVVTNLVTNALTYGQPELVVTVRSSVEQGQCRLDVHNFGPPIPEELLPHLFEPLRRGEQQVKLGSRSVGLGLYIVQQIAAAHGGSVTVKSSLDHGTTFSVHLPVRPAQVTS